MTHDMLCPRLPDDSSERICKVCCEHDCECCQCDLIAKVRDDERNEAFKRARRFLSNNYPAGVFMTAAEFASHAIRNTPFDELPEYLRRGFEHERTD